jgi:hypothetical protein
MGSEAKCTKCDGCGKIANTDDQEPWTVWTGLPLHSATAVLIGLVTPLTCPECGGTGKATIVVFEDDPIHNWFSLSYAQYLTIPRSVLQSMPQEWQRRFVKCLEQLDETIDWRPDEGTYHVELRQVTEVLDEDISQYVEAWGDVLHDPLQDYERGRRKIAHIDSEPNHH